MTALVLIILVLMCMVLAVIAYKQDLIGLRLPSSEEPTVLAMADGIPPAGGSAVAPAPHDVPDIGADPA